MRHKNRIRHLVPESYRCDKVQPEKGEVGDVVLIEGLALKVGVDKPQSAQ